jgi:methionyl-tRNA formyltransferase
MRVGFAGTPAFAAVALEAIHRDGYTIPLVLTRPDRPFGRGLALAACPVKRYAAANGLPVVQPASLRAAETRADLARVPLDVLVVAAYGAILPPAVLAWPRHGCLNVHASLLPRWRGAAPIARAIDAGDATSGITVMQMDEGLDTGPIVLQRPLEIDGRETAGTLHDRLAQLGARAILDALRVLAREGSLSSRPQPDQGATYAAKLERLDSLIDWRMSAAALDRRIRALSPAPGVVAAFHGTPVKVRGAIPVAGATQAPAGTVIRVSPDGIDVACGSDEAASERLLRLTGLQPAGGRPMSAHAFAVGRALAPGARFEPGA